MAALASNCLRHFRLLLWIHWTEYAKTWQEARTRHPLPSLCFWSRSEYQGGQPGLCLAETFSISLKPQKGICQNLIECMNSFSSTTFVFFGPIGKIRWRPASDLLTFSTYFLLPLNRICQEATTQRLLPSLCFSGRSDNLDCRPGLWLAETFSTSSLNPLKGISRNLTGSKKSTSSIKFEFFGPIGKTRFAPGLW